MATRQHILFLFSALAIALHQIIEKIAQIPLPLFDNYGDDFFAMPFILTIFSFEQRYIWQHINRPLSAFEISAFTLFFALFFEELLPLFNPNFTKDYWDYLAYAAGSFCFLLAR